MNVVFRADAGARIGHGHIARCLTLAEALRERAVRADFVCREHEGHLVESVEARGFRVTRLPLVVAAPKGAEVQADWLGAPWLDDAWATRAAVEALGGADWLVVDHYGIDARWEGRLRGAVRRILAIDDMANRPHDCDALLDQNLVLNTARRYDGKVPSGCRQLLGPRFALLQPEYAALHDRIPERAGSVRRILVFFGGADLNNLTGRSIEAFLALRRDDIHLDVVLAPGFSHADAVRELTAGRDNIAVFHGVRSLAPLMARADLALGAAGATSWERLCLGLPSLIVTFADNQRAIAEGLHAEGVARWLGDVDEVDAARITEALREVTDGGVTARWSERCAALVDGRGASRVLAALGVDDTNPVRIRSARPQDIGALALALGQSPDSARDHLRSVEDCDLYVSENARGIDVGYAHAHRVNGEWRIDAVSTTDGSDGSADLWDRALLALRGDRREKLTLAAHGHATRVVAICSDRDSWMNVYTPRLIRQLVAMGCRVHWTHDASEARGDLCFYLSYGRVVRREVLARFAHNLVVHASDLPKGRGWSPLTWQILEGATRIPVTLFEAQEAVDSGPIYLQRWIDLSGTELVDDLRRLLAEATVDMCHRFVSDYPAVLRGAREQSGAPTFYKRRRPVDSRLDPDRSIRDQFDQLRVADNERYPAWFELNDVEYSIQVDRKNPLAND